jgi:hypothetical protein
VVGVRAGLDMDEEGPTRRLGSDFQRRRGMEIVSGVDKSPLEAKFRLVDDIEKIELLPERIVEQSA